MQRLKCKRWPCDMQAKYFVVSIHVWSKQTNEEHYKGIHSEFLNLTVGPLQTQGHTLVVFWLPRNLPQHSKGEGSSKRRWGCLPTMYQCGTIQQWFGSACCPRPSSEARRWELLVIPSHYHRHNQHVAARLQWSTYHLLRMVRSQ